MRIFGYRREGTDMSALGPQISNPQVLKKAELVDSNHMTISFVFIRLNLSLFS